MLNAVIRFSLRYRLLIVVLRLTVMVYGTYLATTLPIDVFPDLDRPRVVIITECPGLATEEVQPLVTQPIEIAILGVAGVQAVRSQTTAGLNVIYVEFTWTTEVRAARQTIQERLTTLGGVLPPGIRPQMTPPASIMGQIVIAGIYRQRGPSGGEVVPIGKTGNVAELIGNQSESQEIRAWRPVDRHDVASWEPLTVEKVLWEPADDALSQRKAVLTVDSRPYEIVFPTAQEQHMALRTTADWIVRPRLLKIPGIAEVFVQGGDRKQYQILVNPVSLLEYDVSLQQVERALQESNINTSGGFAVQGETERPIRILGRLGPLPTRVVEDLQMVPIKRNPDRPILLKNVATVVEGPQFKRGDGSINGQPGVV